MASHPANKIIENNAMTKRTARINPNFGHRRNGTIIVLLLLVLPVLILVVGFAVDAAHMFRTKTEMKAVADLVAKATADALLETQDVNQAISVGQQVAYQNRIHGKPVSLTASNFEFGRSIRQADGRWQFSLNTTPYNSVRVNLSREVGTIDGGVPLYFGSLYGHTVFEPVEHSTASVIDIDICLVLDRSSSMKKTLTDPDGAMYATDPRACVPPMADSRWAALSSAVGVFITELNSSNANKRAGVVTFGSGDASLCGETNTDASLDQPMTYNIGLVNNAMNVRNTTVWNGNTNIDAGVVAAHNHFNSSGRPYSYRVMIVLTDGNYTGADPMPAATAAAADGITIYSITFGDSANQADMIALASAGNGEHHHAPTAASLQTIFRDLAGSFSILTE